MKYIIGAIVVIILSISIGSLYSREYVYGTYPYFYDYPWGVLDIISRFSYGFCTLIVIFLLYLLFLWCYHKIILDRFKF